MPARRRSAVARRRKSPSVGCPATRALSGIGALLNGRQRTCLVLRHQGVDQLIERRALEHRIELVQRQANAVIGDAPLREIVGADALRAIAGADLSLALGGP